MLPGPGFGSILANGALLVRPCIAADVAVLLQGEANPWHVCHRWHMQLLCVKCSRSGRRQREQQRIGQAGESRAMDQAGRSQQNNRLGSKNSGRQGKIMDQAGKGDQSGTQGVVRAYLVACLPKKVAPLCSPGMTTPPPSRLMDRSPLLLAYQPLDPGCREQAWLWGVIFSHACASQTP